MNNLNRNIILWIIIGIFLIALFNMFQGGRPLPASTEIPYSKFLSSLDKGIIKDVTLKGNEITGRLETGERFSTYAPNDPTLVTKLENRGIQFTAQPPEEGGASFFHILLSWFPMLLLIGVWIFFLRQMQSGSNRALGFGKSKARLLNEQQGKVTFDDVAGVEEAKQEVEEIVDYLKDPQKFQRLGGKIPKGVLLVGPPGTGKTLLARAIAGEANVPFFSISGSDFVEMFVGVGASRVRDLFEQGKKNAPCIIFIDELDAVGRHRGIGLGGGNDEREQTLNQLLVEMDGFETNEGVILVAATNRPDVLDQALMRPGRFDRQVVVPLPDFKGREAILKVHMKRVPAGADVDPKVIAKGTPGFSGADLMNLVNEAALIAARLDKRVVMMADFEEAKDKVMMGPERRSMVMTDEEKKLTAYHESGHAIVAFYTKSADPIHKATIIPRGRALGMVVRLPEGDRVSVSREKLMGDIAVAMGGRIAEELIFGPEKVTTGASSDFRMATEMARRMVTEWGMSDIVGPVNVGDSPHDSYAGVTGTSKHVSEETAQTIDKEVRRILDESYQTGKSILETHLDNLHKLTEMLLVHETLTGGEIKDLLEGKKDFKKERPGPVKRQSPRSSVPSISPSDTPGGSSAAPGISGKNGSTASASSSSKGEKSGKTKGASIASSKKRPPKKT